MNSTKFFAGHQQFGSDTVTPALDLLFRKYPGLRVGQSACSKPDVSQFMRKRKHLRSFAIGSIQKHQRRELISEGKTTKLFCVQFPVAVASDNGGGHDKHSGIFCPCNKLP